MLIVLQGGAGKNLNVKRRAREELKSRWYVMVGGFLRLGFVFLSTKAVFILQKCNVSKGYNNWVDLRKEYLACGFRLEPVVIL